MSSSMLGLTPLSIEFVTSFPSPDQKYCGKSWQLPLLDDILVVSCILLVCMFRYCKLFSRVSSMFPAPEPWPER
ncbi:hypothetical protein BDW67DRAFT_152327 [Aspergillus spinulosporus]